AHDWSRQRADPNDRHSPDRLSSRKLPGGRVLHRRCQDAVDAGPRLLDRGSERVAQSFFQSPDQCGTDRVIVRVGYHVASMTATKILDDWYESIEAGKPFHGRCEHLHQFPTLVRHVALEHMLQAGVDFKETAIEQRCRIVGNGRDDCKTALHEFDLRQRQHWPSPSRGRGSRPVHYPMRRSGRKWLMGSDPFTFLAPGHDPTVNRRAYLYR